MTLPMEPTAGTSLVEERFLPLLRCPKCHATASLERHSNEPEGAWSCNRCRGTYVEKAGIPVFLDEPGTADGAPSRSGPGWLQATDERAQAAYFEGDVTHHRQASHPVVRGFASQRWEYLDRLMELDKVESALDVGCGSGFSTLYAPAHLTIMGCDQSLAMLSQTRRRNSLCASALNLPFYRCLSPM